MPQNNIFNEDFFTMENESVRLELINTYDGNIEANTRKRGIEAMVNIRRVEPGDETRY